jgi:hypothetical protein
LSGSYERGKHAEEIAAKWLEAEFRLCFSKKSLPVGIRGDGKIALHSFDLVSEDNQIVAEVKSHQKTKGGNIPSGKISDTYHACSMLEKVKAQKKLLLLTDRAFYDIFKRYSDGKISDDIEVVLVPQRELSETSEVNLVKIYLKNEDFSVFCPNSPFGFQISL